MVKEIIWSIEAEDDLTKILEFYFYKVKAKSYANRLNEIFENELDQIAKNPEIGKSCNSENVRAKIIGNYQIIYENTRDKIYILRIWDSRQNPTKLASSHKKK